MNSILLENYLEAVSRYMRNYGFIDSTTFDKITGSTIDTDLLLAEFNEWEHVIDRAVNTLPSENFDGTEKMSISDIVEINFTSEDRMYKLLRQCIREQGLHLLPVEFDIWCLEDVTSDDLIEDAGSWEAAIERVDKRMNCQPWTEEQIKWCLVNTWKNTEKEKLTRANYEDEKIDYYPGNGEVRRRYRTWPEPVYQKTKIPVDSEQRKEYLIGKIFQRGGNVINTAKLRNNFSIRVTDEKLEEIVASIIETEMGYYTVEDCSRSIRQISQRVSSSNLSPVEYERNRRFSDPSVYVVLLKNGCQWSSYDNTIELEKTIDKIVSQIQESDTDLFSLTNTDFDDDARILSDRSRKDITNTNAVMYQSQIKRLAFNV